MRAVEGAPEAVRLRQRGARAAGVTHGRVGAGQAPQRVGPRRGGQGFQAFKVLQRAGEGLQRGLGLAQCQPGPTHLRPGAHAFALPLRRRLGGVQQRLQDLQGPGRLTAQARDGAVGAQHTRPLRVGWRQSGAVRQQQIDGLGGGVEPAFEHAGQRERGAHGHRRFVASVHQRVQQCGGPCRIGQRGGATQSRQVRGGTAVQRECKGDGVRGQVFAGDSQRFGRVALGQLDLAQLEPVLHQVLDQRAGARVARAHQRAHVRRCRLQQLDATRQLAGVGQRPGVHRTGFDDPRMRRAGTVRGQRRLQRQAGAVACQVKLSCVAVGEGQQHGAGDAQRVAFGQARIAEPLALQCKLFGFGVGAQVQRRQRAVGQCGGQFGDAGCTRCTRRIASRRADLLAQRRQHTVEVGGRLLRPAAQPVHLRLQQQRAQRLQVLGPERRCCLGHGARNHRFCGRHITQREQAFADHVVQFDARAAVPGQCGGEPLVGLLEQVDGTQLLLAAAVIGVGFAEDRGDEVLHVFGPFALGDGNARLPQRSARTAQHAEQQRGRGGHPGAVAQHKFARAVHHAVGPRQHRTVAEVAFDVRSHCIDRGIAVVDAFFQRLQHDGVEVAAQRMAQPIVGHHAAGARHFGRQDGLFQRGARIALQPVGALARQQFEQQHTERIDIAARAHRLAGNLLGRGVVGGQRAGALLRQVGRRQQAFIQQPGNAEVEQLDLPCGIDQQVGRFDVPVHHHLCVGVRHRARQLQEKAESRVHAQALLFAVVVDAQAIDMFKRQVGLAIGGHASVVQARDVRVVQRGQDFALARDARRQVAAEGPVWQLQRHLSLRHQPVGTLRQPDHAHAAGAQFAQQPVRPDQVACSVAAGLRSAAVMAAVRGVQRGQRIEKLATRHTPGAGQQLAQWALEFIVLWRQCRHPGLALRRRQVQRGVQQRVQAQPGGGVDAEPGFHRGVFRSASVEQRACQQQARLFPVAPHRAWRGAQGLCDLGFRQAAEVAHLDHLRQPLVDLRQFLQRFVYAHDLVSAGRALVSERVGQRDDEHIAAMTFGLPLAREVHDHRAHGAAGVGQVARVLHRAGLAVGRAADDAQVGLVHERGGVEQGLAPAAAQARPCDHAQLAVSLCRQRGRGRAQACGQFGGGAALHVRCIAAGFGADHP